MTPIPDQSKHRRSPGGASTPLIDCYTYAAGYRWYWRQRHDHFPGQPVVLIHGLLVRGGHLIPLAEEISAWAPVFIPDLPGFGLSTGADQALSVPELAVALAEWMTVAGIASAHILGISFGSQVAVELALRFPRRVRSLALVGPTIDPAAHSLTSQAGRVLSDLPLEPIRLWIDDLSGAVRCGLRLLTGNIRMLLGDRIETKLPRVKAPALIIRGAQDPIAPESWTRLAVKLLPNARHLTIPDAAHYVHFSHPAQVSAAVRTLACRGRKPGTRS